MTFGERLILLREENGFKTRKKFAEKLNIPETTLRNYETGAREPGHTFLKQISDFFNVSVDYLLGLTDEKDKFSSHQLKSSEFDHIEKYRNLDLYGKETVSYILNRETERVSKYGCIGEPGIISIIEAIPTTDISKIIPYWQEGAAAGSGIYQLNDTESIPLKLFVTAITKQADFAIKVSGESMAPDYHDGDRVLVNQKATVQLGDVGIFIKNGNSYIKEMGTMELVSRNPEYPNISVNEFDNIVCLGKVIGKITDDMIVHN